MFDKYRQDRAMKRFQKLHQEIRVKLITELAALLPYSDFIDQETNLHVTMNDIMKLDNNELYSLYEEALNKLKEQYQFDDYR